MTKGFLKRNGFLFAAGVGGGLLAKALGFSSDTSLLFAGLCFIIVLQGYQAANTATR